MQNILNQIILTNEIREAARKEAAKNQAAEIEKFNKMLDSFYLEIEKNQY